MLGNTNNSKVVRDCFYKEVYKEREPFDKLAVPHLGLALLAVDDLGWDDLGGGGLGYRAHAFGLGDDHLGDGSGGGDDRRFGPLNSLQAFLPLKHTQQHIIYYNISDYKQQQHGRKPQ